MDIPYKATCRAARWGTTVGTVAYMATTLPEAALSNAALTVGLFSYMNGMIAHTAFVGGMVFGDALEDHPHKRGNGVVHGKKGFAGALIGLSLAVSLVTNPLTRWVENDFAEMKKITEKETVQKPGPDTLSSDTTALFAPRPQ